MKIAFLCKRHYMQKDVIDDRYARLYELPKQLALIGHHIQGICLGYHRCTSGHFIHINNNSSSLEWHGFDAGRLIISGLLNYFANTFLLIKQFKPDILLGSSDCLHTIITALFAKLFNIPYYLDLYDNYESFGLAKLPGLLPLYRLAIRNAKGISCVSEPLADYIRQRYQHRNIITLESTITGNDFFPQNKTLCRQHLNLPAHAKLIGLAGSLDKNRGVDLLYAGFLQLADNDSSVHLVLAGPTDPSCPIPNHPRVHYLGLLPHRQINGFYSALDLAMICLRDGEFGRYAFPQKTYEILATETPILATNVGAVGQTFRDHPECLYTQDDLADFCNKASYLLNSGYTVRLPIPSWADQARRLIEWINS
ncbi:glycosyltransferase family 4 protein [Methylococcaceae bacterium WWC4]|nr:glycosyltransferase family 4 protein [Methylococcaceae bacterium WWC4]